jgi:hypothetical protein
VFAVVGADSIRPLVVFIIVGADSISARWQAKCLWKKQVLTDCDNVRYSLTISATLSENSTKTILPKYHLSKYLNRHYLPVLIYERPVSYHNYWKVAYNGIKPEHSPTSLFISSVYPLKQQPEIGFRKKYFLKRLINPQGFFLKRGDRQKD